MSQSTEPTPGQAPEAGRTIVSIAPATSEKLGEVPVYGAAEVRAAVERARVAQAAWARLELSERCERILRFRDALVERSDEVLDLLSRECGKPRIEALVYELIVLSDLTTWMSRNAERVLASRDVHPHLWPHRKSHIRYVPRRVVGIISPWNFPLMIPFCDAVTAIVTGAAVVIKPSEQTPLIALLAKKIWDASGLPEDLLQVVTGDGQTGSFLIDAGIDKLCFTGGVSTGRKVAAQCGERLVECAMELGGKAPLIVCDDADIERAARATVYGGFANSGQICISVERVLAARSLYQPLVERVAELTASLRQGDPSAEEVDVGAIIFPRQAEIAETFVQDALAKGAKLKSGGERLNRKGLFFAPTVLADCTLEMRVMNEETFGPLVAMMPVEDDQHAIEIANSLSVGLNAYVFTKDRNRGVRIAEQLEAGSVVVNDVFTDYGSAEVPFGGVKNSGFGRIHGEEALRSMCTIQHISVNRVPPPSSGPLWFPYSRTPYVLAEKLLHGLYSGKNPLRRLAGLFNRTR